MFEKAIEIVSEADILLIIGTSMQVYPAANLVNFINTEIPVYFIDPKPAIQKNYFPNLTVIAEKASEGVAKVVTELIE
jgi:NAD-dependent deacetylase